MTNEIALAEICAGCKSLDTTPIQLLLCGCQCHGERDAKLVALHVAYYESKAADDAFSAALRDAGIDRWSRGSNGEPGSKLRAAYLAKIAADEKRSNLSRELRDVPIV